MTQTTTTAASEPAAQPAPIAPGAIFRCSWGYDQTNVDFYEVMSVTASGKTVKVRQIQSHCIDDNPGAVTHVIPWREPHRFNTEVLTKRLRATKYGPTPTWAFRVASYAHAYLWDGAPAYETGQGAGH